jgi:uncharacterized protein (DUF2164 family)
VPIKLSKPTEQRLIASIRRYCAANLDDIGDLQASLLLDFCLREIGPSIYNQAVADAQAYMQNQVIDLNSTCFEPEDAYWPGRTKARR